VWIEQAEGEGELQSEVGWYAKESIEMTFGWRMGLQSWMTEKRVVFRSILTNIQVPSLACKSIVVIDVSGSTCSAPSLHNRRWFPSIWFLSGSTTQVLPKVKLSGPHMRQKIPNMPIGGSGRTASRRRSLAARNQVEASQRLAHC
jgi:hypothetical protein